MTAATKIDATSISKEAATAWNYDAREVQVCNKFGTRNIRRHVNEEAIASLLCVDYRSRDLHSPLYYEDRSAIQPLAAQGMDVRACPIIPFS